MDVVYSIISGILLVTGLVGCLLPILPGTPLSYIGLLVLQLRSETPFTMKFMLFWAVITVAIVILDYLIPAYGTKKFGGTKFGMYGTMIGLVAGLIFFPPLGIIIGPLLGALAGELLAGTHHKKAIKAALGSFAGFIAGTLIKITASAVMLFYYFSVVF